MEILKTKEQYQKEYKTRKELLYQYFMVQGYEDPSYMAILEFDKTATVDEIAGYYISNYEDLAYKQWKENTKTKFTENKASETDKAVEKILKNLYQ